MRLIRPSPGELADRQVILSLKINHAQVEVVGDDEPKHVKSGNIIRTVVDNKTKVNVQPFYDELELVQNHLKNHWIPDISMTDEKVVQYDKLFDALVDVNTKLWDLEDQARVLRAAPDKFFDVACRQAAEVLFAITELNDNRAKLVQEINAIWKITSQEKLH